jgi:FPC/CPF motif-containing protein YcgG
VQINFATAQVKKTKERLLAQRRKVRKGFSGINDYIFFATGASPRGARGRLLRESFLFFMVFFQALSRYDV